MRMSVTIIKKMITVKVKRAVVRRNCSPVQHLHKIKVLMAKAHFMQNEIRAITVIMVLLMMMITTTAIYQIQVHDIKAEVTT